MDYNDVSQWAADLGSGYSRIYPLGEGGMGTLYCAHKDSLDVDVVIKRVKQKFKGRMDERAEANILKTLKHKYTLGCVFRFDCCSCNCRSVYHELGDAGSKPCWRA